MQTSVPHSRPEWEGHSVCFQAAQLYREKEGFTIHRDVLRPKYGDTHERESSLRWDWWMEARRGWFTKQCFAGLWGRAKSFLNIDIECCMMCLGGAESEDGPGFLEKESHKQRQGRVKTHRFLGSLADPMCLQWRVYRDVESQRVWL